MYEKIECETRQARDQLAATIFGSWTGYSVSPSGYRWFVHVIR